MPVAIYRDGHSAFAPTRPGLDDDPDAPSLSQVGRALVELGIASITAGSPQAKGRIERAWGTFQSRLVVVLRLAGASDLASANLVLAGYLPGFNARFAVPPADQVAAWRPVPDGIALERVFCFKYRRKVARDHTVTLGLARDCDRRAALPSRIEHVASRQPRGLRQPAVIGITVAGHAAAGGPDASEPLEPAAVPAVPHRPTSRRSVQDVRSRDADSAEQMPCQFSSRHWRTRRLRDRPASRSGRASRSGPPPDPARLRRHNSPSRCTSAHHAWSSRPAASRHAASRSPR